MDENDRDGSAQDDARGESGPQGEQVDRRLLELLVCPLTKTSLVFDPVRHELISKAARLAFPIRDGVPMMTVEAARHLDETDN
jgi:uncharacterized protein YbaR (Trm112 family)